MKKNNTILLAILILGFFGIISCSDDQKITTIKNYNDAVDLANSNDSNDQKIGKEWMEQALIKEFDSVVKKGTGGLISHRNGWKIQEAGLPIRLLIAEKVRLEILGDTVPPEVKYKWTTWLSDCCRLFKNLPAGPVLNRLNTDMAIYAERSMLSVSSYWDLYSHVEIFMRTVIGKPPVEFQEKFAQTFSRLTDALTLEELDNADIGGEFFQTLDDSIANRLLEKYNDNRKKIISSYLTSDSLETLQKLSNYLGDKNQKIQKKINAILEKKFEKCKGVTESLEFLNQNEDYILAEDYKALYVRIIKKSNTLEDCSLLLNEEYVSQNPLLLGLVNAKAAKIAGI